MIAAQVRLQLTAFVVVVSVRESGAETACSDYFEVYLSPEGTFVA
jgi:hypothetical protein